jgi:chromosome segregation ATPase
VQKVSQLQTELASLQTEVASECEEHYRQNFEVAKTLKDLDKIIEDLKTQYGEAIRKAASDVDTKGERIEQMASNLSTSLEEQKDASSTIAQDLETVKETIATFQTEVHQTLKKLEDSHEETSRAATQGSTGIRQQLNTSKSAIATTTGIIGLETTFKRLKAEINDDIGGRIKKLEVTSQTVCDDSQEY